MSRLFTSMSQAEKLEFVRKKQKDLSALEEVNFDDFVFKTPLYSEKKISSHFALTKLLCGGLPVDGYCTKCRKETIFKNTRKFDVNVEGKVVQASEPKLSPIRGARLVPFNCIRNIEHCIEICVSIEYYFVEKHRPGGPVEINTAGRIKKIGQHPSFADVANAGLRDLDSVLHGVDRREFGTANGLASHGANIGAFVYLRRVFERLMDRAKENAKDEVEEKDYQDARVPNRIEILSHYLPPFMVENKRVYGILSKGIHELDEEQCGRIFSLLRESCLLMLTQEREILERKKRESELSKLIGGIKIEDIESEKE